MKNISKLLVVVLCLVMALCALTACGGGNTDDKYDGKLVVATSPDFPPFENLVDGEIVGIEADLIKLICEELNYELVFENVAFDSIITGVETGKYDCGVAGISVDPERAESVLFTTPYCLAAQCIVVSADSAIAGKADLADKTIAVQSGTTAEKFCSDNGYTIDSYESNGDAKLALTTGKVQAWVVDDLTAAEMCKADADVKILDERMTSEPYAFVFNFEDEELVETINAILEGYIADGTIKAIFETHGAIYTAPAVDGDDSGDTKTITVATSPDFPPFENLEGGEIVGIEVELMKLICAELGYEFELVPIAFDAVVPGIETGKYVCGMSGISVTPAREQSVLFTTPYCLAAQCIVVTADSEITGKADLTGLKVSVQSGTTAEEFCLENGYTVDSYEANADAKLALTTGKVQAWIVDDLTAAEMCKGDSSVKILDESMTTEPYAFAFNFKDEALVEEFNAVLEQLIADGTVADLFEQFDAPYTAPTVAE